MDNGLQQLTTDQLYAAAFDILAGEPEGGRVVRFDASEFREDSWWNPQTGIGDTSESAETSFAPNRLLTLQELANIFYGDDLAYRVVALLPQEAMKRKPILKHKRATPEQIERVSKRLDNMRFQTKVRDAATFGRLFGDCGLWMATGNDQTQPFQRGEPVRFIKQLDRRILLAAGYYVDPNNENLGTPSAYSVVPVGMTLNYRNLGTEVHETRIPMFSGLRLDPIQRAYNMGWNYSILQRIYNTIRDMGETWQGISILLRELSIKVLKVKGLQAANTTRPDLVRFRLRQARQNLSVLKMLAIDADLESFDRVESGTLTGAAQVLEQVLLRVSAAAEMPVTRLYGRSPSGLQATGDADERQWHDSVTTYQTNELLPSMLAIAEAVAAPMFPELVGGWEFEFPPLREPTAAELQAQATAVSTMDTAYVSAGVFTAEQIATLRGGPNGHMRPDYTSLDVSVQAALSRMPPPRDPGGQEGGEDNPDQQPPPPAPPAPGNPPPGPGNRGPGEPPIPGVS